MTFSTFYKIFINVITNNIHRSPKLILLSGFLSVLPSIDPLIWSRRQAHLVFGFVSTRGELACVCAGVLMRICEMYSSITEFSSPGI